jgi:hypothetical protein
MPTPPPELFLRSAAASRLPSLTLGAAAVLTPRLRSRPADRQEVSAEIWRQTLEACRLTPVGLGNTGRDHISRLLWRFPTSDGNSLLVSCQVSNSGAGKTESCPSPFDRRTDDTVHPDSREQLARHARRGELLEHLVDQEVGGPIGASSSCGVATF